MQHLTSYCSLLVVFNEQEIISRILCGDLKAFELLVKQYERLVFHVVGRLIKERADAEDVCQEVFIKIHRNLAGYNYKSRLSTWIARIAYLSAIDYLKKYKKLSQTELNEDFDQYHFTYTNPEQLMEKKDTSAYINQLILQMPEQYRIVLTLFHLDEFSYQEIEVITGMAEGTIKSYLFRGRKLLKEKLEAYLKNEIV